MALGIVQLGTIAGKLNGTMEATTPSGTCSVRHSTPYISKGSETLLNKFPDEKYFKGITVTCPGFYGPQGRILRLPLAAPGLINKLTDFKYGNHRITNFEMETSAIFGLGKLLGHQCMSINTIVANRVKQQFSKDSDAAVENMIKTSLEYLASPNLPT